MRNFTKWKSKIFLISILLLSLVAFSCSTHQGGEKQLLNMELQDTIVNIGKITVGETKEFDFWVYNSSDDSVLVDLVTPDCHCTKVEYKNAYFQSGDTIKFHILFDTHREVPGEWDRYINLQFRSAVTGEIVDYGFTFIYEV